MLVAEDDIDRRTLSTLHVPKRLVLADCTSERARSFGVTAAIHSSEEYGRTQEWADAFARAGFDGIRYLISHDPRQRLIGIAVFGPAGARAWPAPGPVAIPVRVLREAGRRFGVRALPVPR